MQLHLPEQLLSRLSERVATDMGLHFPRERWRELEAGVQSAADELGISDAASCAHRLLSAPLSREQVEILATGLTIGETYFFREDGSFKAIAGQILPELLRARRESGRRLRIWSAGCCTGEEPYSIAIMLERAIPDIADWQITLLATDVNPRFLRKAVDGTFGEWSFRDPPPWLKSTYFTSVAAHRYAISPRLRQRVSFAYLNLADEAYPSLATNTNAMDLIFCRNVLMYFPPAQAGCVVDRFHRSLAPQGWLVVGGADGTSQLLNEFAPTQFDGSVLYRKRPAPALPAAFAGSPLPDDSFLETAAAFGRIEVANATAGIADSPPAEAAIAQPNPHTQALALFGRGRYADARRMLESIAFGAATPNATLILLARVCANLGDLAHARYWAERAVAADRINAPLHYLRAVILEEQGLADEALLALKRALYLAPEFVLAHVALGNLARGAGRARDANRHFTNALGLLGRCKDEDLLPHAEGMAVGALRRTIQSVMDGEVST